jgi:chromosome partitioning protein
VSRIYAIANQKGGVGKTTTVANLGAAIATRGHRLCLIDMDPQAHLTLHMGLEPGANNPGLYEVLTGDASMNDAAVKITENLSAVPSVIDLAAAETELVTVVGREQILHDRLSACNGNYDYVMIDCPPSLGLLTLNALAAADYVFIPLQAHFLALQGLGMLLKTVSLVQQRINPRLKVGGVILCMHEKQTRLAGEVVADLQEFLQAARGTGTPWADAEIFETPIRRNIKLAECPSYGKTIFDYDPNSHGATDYQGLAEEFIAFFSPKETKPVNQVEESVETIEPKPEPAPAPVPEPAPEPEVVSHPDDEPKGEFRSETEPTAPPAVQSIESTTAPIPPQPLQ